MLNLLGTKPALVYDSDFDHVAILHYKYHFNFIFVTIFRIR